MKLNAQVGQHGDCALSIEAGRREEKRWEMRGEASM